jgi:hypothetical protein
MVYVLWTLAIGVVALTVFCRRSVVARRVAASEESAHSAALRRRRSAEADFQPGNDRRRERRFSCTRRHASAQLLGEDTQFECSIANVSRSGMRLVTRRDLPLGSQLQIHWDEEFFVGVVCHIAIRGADRVAGLKLISSSYCPTSIARSLSHAVAMRFKPVSHE